VDTCFDQSDDSADCSENLLGRGGIDGVPVQGVYHIVEERRFGPVCHYHRFSARRRVQAGQPGSD